MPKTRIKTKVRRGLHHLHGLHYGHPELRRRSETANRSNRSKHWIDRLGISWWLVKSHVNFIIKWYCMIISCFGGAPEIATQPPAKNVVIIRILQVPVPDPAAHAPGSAKIHEKGQSYQEISDPWITDKVRHPRLKGLKKSYFWQHVAAIAKPR